MQDEDYLKYPQLREDLKISKMVNKKNVGYVIKDPLKDQYFKYSESEWDVVSLFISGKKKLEQLVEDFNSIHKNKSIDLETLKSFQEELNSTNLLIKSKKEMNVMLVEKMKEMRKSQLLGKSGSLFYKRFPIIDPDKFFDKYIPYLKWVWSKTFLLVSLLIMLGACYIVSTRMNEFKLGMFSLFNFSEQSLSHLAMLWVIIYITIAIHEFGHGLTCKYYGGEVHEIGFLLLFFQPCLYCNVNDAWLFDKKWKQIMVTIAGGYIEFLIGAICCYIWALSVPHSFIHNISFQVMTICSVSTVLFNFNPLIKLDGYYLLSDFLEVPNLKEESGNYIKYFVSKYIFRMKEEEFSGTRREKRIYLIYGFFSTCWTASTMVGLIVMAKTVLVEKFYFLGIILTGFVAYKFFGDHVTKTVGFIKKWAISHIEFLRNPRTKKVMIISFVAFFLLMFFPVHYKIKGKCLLNPSDYRIIRMKVDGKIERFVKHDGETIIPFDTIAEISNISLFYDREIASLDFHKSHQKLRKTLLTDPKRAGESSKDLASKKLVFEQKDRAYQDLNVIFTEEDMGEKVVLSCENEHSKKASFLKKGDEICKAMAIDQLKTSIEIEESEVRYLQVGQEVKFKLMARPIDTFTGVIAKITPSGKSNPKNPQSRVYTAEIVLQNRGDLLPGMSGIAKIFGEKMILVKYLFLLLAQALRLDLFY